MTDDPIPNLGNEAAVTLFDALDLAIERAQTDGFAPFFLSVAADGEKTMAVCIDNEESFSVEGSVALARQRLAAIDRSTRCVALAWDGYLTLEEDRTEAVFVEAYELGRPKGALFAWRYHRDNGALHPIGNPLKLNQVPDPLVPLPPQPTTDRRAEAIARIQQLADARRQRDRQ